MNPTADTPTLEAEMALFVRAAKNVFEVMLQTPLDVTEDPSSDAATGVRVTTAVIGIQGSTSWNVAVCFDDESAQSIAKKLFQSEGDLEDHEVGDALGEVANMVGGGAKAELASLHDEAMNLGLPTVVSGVDYKLNQPPESLTRVVNFTSELGQFSLTTTFVKR
jgi:chemotaxis protein CheX